MISNLRVFARPGSHKALLLAGSTVVPCTIGKGGATRVKREGDHCTPRGRMKALEWYAPPGAPRLPRLHGVPKTITPAVGWCDDPASPAYNRAVRLPARASHESMARTDGKYDMVGVLDWNLRPRIRTRGSAIFFHINDDPQTGTEGCVALPRHAMRRLLPRLARHVTIEVV